MDDRICDGGRPSYDAGGGSLLPNSFQVPNLYVDRLLPLLTDAEWRVLIYTARRIFGFHKRQDKIPLSQFVEGTLTERGQRLDFGTGLSKKAIIDALRSLAALRILLVIAPADEARRIPAEYALELDAGRIDFAALEARWIKRQETGKSRTQAARKARGSSHEPVRGLSDEPGFGVSPTEKAGLVPQRKRGLCHEPSKPRGNQEETKREYVPTPAAAPLDNREAKKREIERAFFAYYGATASDRDLETVLSNVEMNAERGVTVTAEHIAAAIDRALTWWHQNRETQYPRSLQPFLIELPQVLADSQRPAETATPKRKERPDIRYLQRPDREQQWLGLLLQAQRDGDEALWDQVQVEYEAALVRLNWTEEQREEALRCACGDAKYQAKADRERTARYAAQAEAYRQQGALTAGVAH